jgi:hypothetical protein
MTWSPPFHGVQHLDGLKRGFQVTVEDRETWAVAYALEGLRTLAESDHDTVAQAREWGEERARLLGLVPA